MLRAQRLGGLLLQGAPQFLGQGQGLVAAPPEVPQVPEPGPQVGNREHQEVHEVDEELEDRVREVGKGQRGGEHGTGGEPWGQALRTPPPPPAQRPGRQPGAHCRGGVGTQGPGQPRSSSLSAQGLPSALSRHTERCRGAPAAATETPGTLLPLCGLCVPPGTLLMLLDHRRALGSTGRVPTLLRARRPPCVPWGPVEDRQPEETEAAPVS